MPKIWRVYSGADGQSHVEEMPLAMKPFTDTEGAHGEGTTMQSVAGLAFRVAPPGYVLDWHCAPRRQYSITLSGQAEIQVGDGTVVRVGPGDVLLAEDLTGRATSPARSGAGPASTPSSRSPDSDAALRASRGAPPAPRAPPTSPATWPRSRTPSRPR